MDSTYLASLITVILSRALERVLLVLAGALAIYLGYRLFAVIPAADKSEGRISLPGGVSIFLTRIGPGVFFALFGCVIIGYSATRPVDFRIPVELSAGRIATSTETKTGGVIHYSGLGPPAGARALSGAIDAAVVVGRLNFHFDDMRQRLDRIAAAELDEALRTAKLAVMLGAWKSDWGDRDAFANWVAAGAPEGDPPTERAAGAAVAFGTRLR